MRTKAIGHLVLLLLACAALDAAAQLPTTPRPLIPAEPPAANLPRYVTGQTTFAIPFSVPPLPGQAVEIQLYVSRDAGASWQLAQRQMPHARQFTFRAAQEGGYWFASRTISGSTARPNQQPLRAELHIVVDTTEPQLQFSARAGEPGQVITTWQATDPNLDAGSLKIEYQTRTGLPWQPVSLERPADVSGRTTWRGQQAWQPASESTVLNLRAEVQDRAGNRTVVNRRLLLPAASSPPTRRAADQRLAAAPGRPGTPAGLPWPSDNRPLPDRPSQPRNPFGSTPALAGSRAAPPTGPRDAGPALEQLTRLPATAPSPPPAANGQLPDPRTGAAARPAPQPADETSPRDGTDTGTRWPTTTGSPAVPARVVGNPRAWPELAPPGDQPDLNGPVLAPVSSDRGGLISAAGELPPGERPQMTSAPHFQLDYDVESVGSSGVAEVQLWATEDGGQTWRLWGTDDDRQSPFDVQAERDGIYGFRVVIVSNNGLIGPRPQAGDPADIWVGIDTRQPVAELTGARYGQNQRAGKLIIQWRAEDSALGSRPVSVLFSESPDGPWTPIATALPNTGEYEWAADPQLPPRVYLRLEVRDQAGNVAFDQTGEPIRIDGLAPKARIRGLMRAAPTMDREAFRQPQRR